MIEPSRLLPGDPSELHLRISYEDELWDTPQADTLERWNVAVLHRRRTHHGGQGPAPSSDCVTVGCLSCPPETGSFTGEASERLEYIGSALLVMDRVMLDPPWRGHGLAAVPACEAITRLMAGCWAIACSPGITDLSSRRLMGRSEWDRVNARITQGWERLGFRPYRDNVYLLSPASQNLEEQRGALRQHLADLGGLWRTDAPRSVSLADEAGSPESL